MAQLDAHLTGDQEVVGLIPIGSVNILLWKLIMKYFLPLIQEGQLSVFGERMCTSTDMTVKVLTGQLNSNPTLIYHLIWVYTDCPGLSVPVLRVNIW